LLGDIGVTKYSKALFLCRNVGSKMNNGIFLSPV
jgi:hypothetical protein